MKRIWVNGCFDILHPGHIELLRYAKSLGDILYVGIDSDENVSLNKGPLRPVHTASYRQYMLESIRYVDTTMVFQNSEDLVECIKSVEPDIVVVGSDWKGKNIVGADYAKEVRYFGRISNYSTTQFLESFVDR